MDNTLTDIGRLQVSVLLPNVLKPASGTVVRITAANDEKNVIEEIITDQSGQTPVINLPAPPLEYSMSPDMSRPFSTYDVYIDTTNYQSTVIKGVQIFPNTTALQNVELTEKIYIDQPPRQIDIDDPTLYGNFPPKIPEDMVKPLPTLESGFVVLPEVVIPEFIIVHDGAPNDASAPNYTVPYVDYIKNVMYTNRRTA